MGDVVCPYCLSKVTASKVKYVCNRCGKELKVNAFELALGKIPKCPDCKSMSSVNIQCPTCESELPSDIFQYSKNIRFAIVGTSGSGKTNYITTMIEEMKRSRMGLTLSHMNAETINTHRQEMQRIYYDLQPSDATYSGDVHSYQWRIQDARNLKSKNIPSYALTIFDGAGEDQMKMESDPILNSYITQSKYIIFLVDPISLPGLRSKLNNQELVEWSSGGHSHELSTAEELVMKMANLIRRNNGISVAKKVDIPIAIVFTKIDLLMEEFGMGKISQSSPHASMKAFVESDMEEVNLMMRQFLEDIGEISLMDAVDVNFSKVRFFGVSSFGHPPIERARLANVSPHRVLDPLLWILSLENIVPIKK